MSNPLTRCEQYKQMIKDGAKLVDVRTSGEFSAGALPESINIPLQSLPANMQQLDKEAGIVLYCLSGQRSSMAARFLAQAGYNNIHDLGSYQNAGHC